MNKPLTIVVLILLSATALNARPTRNFQFWKFGYQWTTDSGKAPGPGSFSPSHVSPLTSAIGLTLTETSSGSIVGGEARTLDRFLYGTFQWTEDVSVQVSGQIALGSFTWPEHDGNRCRAGGRSAEHILGDKLGWHES